MLHALATLILAAAGPTRLAQCDSGKTGHIQLFVEANGQGGFTLTSKDDVEGPEARVFSGTVRSATHKKLDKRHHVYTFAVENGQFQQGKDLDTKSCKTDGEIAHCGLDTIEIKLARHGTRGPGDDGLAALTGPDAIAMDNGGPQNCTVYASKALTALLKAGK